MEPRRALACSFARLASPLALALAAALALPLAAGCAAAGARPGPEKKPPKPPGPPLVIAGAVPSGWATVADLGLRGTTGGGSKPGVRVTNEAELYDAITGDEPQNVLLMRSVSGTFEIGSNKTLIGGPGAVLHGHLGLNGSTNVIVRNLKIVGYNCADSSECKHGKDAVTLYGAAHHVWFDHCEISDGSDGNLDITEGSDYVTVSWTIFSYSGRRSGAHQYANLIGNSDTADDADRGHLRVTFDHVWWADNVSERMPRVRFGQVHVFNSLYSAADNHYCVGLGAGANILLENNAFIGVHTPIESAKFADADSVLVARGNLFARTDGTTAGRGPEPAGFKPPYAYKLEPATTVRASVTRGAGLPRPASDVDDDDQEPGAPPAAARR